MTDRSASGRPPARQEPDDSHRTVASLLEERSKYQAWMDALDARRDSSPEHVFRRVRRDYEERLAQVARQLAKQIPALRTTVRELTEKITELRVEESALQDQRAEAELRAHVGELAGEKWDKVARKHDDGIRSVTERREALEKQLEAVEELVASARDSIEMAAIPEAPDEEEGEVMSPDLEEEDEVREAARPEKLDDEMAFLRSVTDQRSSGAQQPRKPKPAVPASASKPAEGAKPREAPKPAEAPPAEAPRAAEPPAVEPPAVEPPKPAAPDQSERPNGISADPSPDKESPRRESGETFFDPSDDANPLRDLRAERPIVAMGGDLVLRADASQPKTLKCAGCGTMNFPTEWYCERCGAELAEL